MLYHLTAWKDIRDTLEIILSVATVTLGFIGFVAGMADVGLPEGISMLLKILGALLLLNFLFNWREK